ncbi:MAG: S41 family peptidase [Ignavibacteria bacterium]
MTSKSKYLFIPLIVIVFSGFFKGDGDIYFQVSKNIDIFGRVYKEAAFNYVDQLNPEEFMVSGINGMLASLDPYTVFMDEKRKGDIDLLTSGKYGGIGVSIGLRNNNITIIDILDGYSAQRQGIRIGDILTMVNNTKVTKENFEEVSSLVKGTPGTEVELTIQRGTDEILKVKLQREEVSVKNLVYGNFVPENSNNVYLKLVGFSRTAGDEMQKILNELKNKKEIKSVVLDLRGNPGGLLEAAVDVCEKFLKKYQLIVSVKGRDSTGSKAYHSREEPAVGNAKVIVLVDSSSASASEIVTAAIQDHDRGVILGTNTFGKGLVQTIVPLSYNTSLKITTAKYFTPSGRCIQKINYSKNNKIFADNNIAGGKSYMTDNNRKVFDAGGIRPDTFVVNNTEINIIEDLQSKGLIFKFATNFTSRQKKEDFVKTSSDVIYNSFLEFLKMQNYSYKSKAEKQISELLSTAEKEKYSRVIINQLEGLEGKIKDLRDIEIKNHKNDIVANLKNEIITRYEGSLGRIRESLNTDKQFNVALDVILNEGIYKHLLTHH